MSRELKFKIYKGSELIGIECVGKNGWEWMAYSINPDNGERWTPGTMPENRDYNRCQYTGLKDKNGTEIYEGDLCQWEDEGMTHARPMIWDKNAYGFRIKMAVGYMPSFKLIAERVEVIGDIHRNPELLKP